MTERLSLRAKLWRSPWDAEAYRACASGRIGGSLFYLGALIALVTFVFTIQAHLTLSRFVNDFKASQSWEKNFPEIRIEQGKVKSPVTQPFVRQFDDFVFILDTTGATQDLDPQRPSGILVTEKELIYHRKQQGVMESRRYALEKFPDLLLNQKSIEQVLDRIKAWAWGAVAAALFVWLWVAKLLQVLFWSLLGLLVNALSKRGLPYRAIFNIGILGLTTPLAFDLLRHLLRWPVWSDWASWALYVGYLIWGILVQPKPTNQTVPVSRPGAVS